MGAASVFYLKNKTETTSTRKLVSLTSTVLNYCILTTSALTVSPMFLFCSSRQEISVLTAWSSCHTHTYSVDTQQCMISEINRNASRTMCMKMKKSLNLNSSHSIFFTFPFNHIFHGNAFMLVIAIKVVMKPEL